MPVFPFESLAPRMNALGRLMPKIGTKLVRDVSRGIGATVVDTTPVDTGLARSNWQASLNAPVGMIHAYAEGNNLGIAETANASAAKAQQRQVIESFDALKHQKVVISNRVPYIGFLDRGSRNTRASNIVAQGLQTGRAVLQASCKKVLEEVRKGKF